MSVSKWFICNCYFVENYYYNLIQSHNSPLLTIGFMINSWNIKLSDEDLLESYDFKERVNELICSSLTVFLNQ